VGNHRTTFATAEKASPAISGAQAARQSQGAVCDSVRAQDGSALGAPAAGTGLGLWDDGLASLACVAEGPCVEQNPRGTARPFAASRADRLVTSDRRFLLNPCGARRKKTGPSPTDRGKAGSKHHLITDAGGIPLAATVTGANAHDVTQLLPLVEAIPPVRGKRGRPRKRPRRVQGDRAYDSEPHRHVLRKQGIEPVLAKRNTEHGSGLGVYRWVVERSISWLHQLRRLRTRYERRDDIHEAFLTLGCIVICSYFL
jgi:transposase